MSLKGNIKILSKVEFDKEMKHLPLTAAMYYYNEKESKMDFNNGFPESFWERGRLFSSQWEYRWGEEGYFKLYEDTQGIWDVQEKHIFLWSSDDKRIQRDIPWKQVIVHEYLFRGKVEGYRLKGVIP